jgi:hypothetical protein
VYPLALVAMLCLAFRLEWHHFRPDPFMSACAALALVAIARPELTHRSSLLAGAWFGLGAGFSPKLWPLLLLLPARALWRGWRTRSPGPLAHLASYALGGVLGAAPVLVWLTAHQLWNPFLVEVVAFNSAYPKPPDGALGFLRRPLLLAAIAGAGVMGWRARTERAGTRWPLAATAGATLLGLSAILSTVQSATYNVQVATVPASVAFAFAGAAIAGRRASLVRLIFLAMFLTVSVRREVVGMLHPGVGPGDIATPDLVALMDLARARPGGGCVGFAPCHPVFCKGPAEVSLLWDVVFLHHPDPGFRARQRGYFEQAIAEIPRSRPSVVVGECLGKNPWKEAVRNGAAGEEALRVMLHELAAGYQIHANRSSLVWAR